MQSNNSFLSNSTKNTFMKKMISIAMCIIAFKLSFSQSYKFDGDWSGKISIDGGSETTWVRIKIQSSSITQYFYDEQSSVWEPTYPSFAKYDYNKNNYIYFWMNNSAVWSETQTYMLSYVNSDKLYIVWSRQVNNIQTGDYDAWSLQGTGYLTRRD